MRDERRMCVSVCEERDIERDKSVRVSVSVCDGERER